MPWQGGAECQMFFEISKIPKGFCVHTFHLLSGKQIGNPSSYIKARPCTGEGCETRVSTPSIDYQKSLIHAGLLMGWGKERV